MKRDILVLGYFGFDPNQLDGQTIKTRNVFELLKSHETEIGTINYFDTQCFQKSRLNILVMFGKILHSKRLVYLPAQNNLKFLFPFIYLICKIKRIDILYFVVGGWLAEFLKNKKLHTALLRKISGIYSETESLANNLKMEYKFKNVTQFPNFRIQSFIPSYKVNTDVFKIVFMARVDKMKGIETVFELAEYFIKYPPGNIPIIIDFYGPIEKNDDAYFMEELKKSNNTQYKGIIDPADIYHTLEQYDVMILPTKYYTEGFPGSILDAYISGIPVIVTKWKHAHEFVDHGSTGYIIPFKNGVQHLAESIMKIYEDHSLLLQMKHNAYNKSEEYSSKTAWNIIHPYLSKFS